MIRRTPEFGGRPESDDRHRVGHGGWIIICLCGLVLVSGLTGCQTASQPAETLAEPVAASPVSLETTEDPAPTLRPMDETLPVTATAIRLVLPSDEPTIVMIPLTAATATIAPTQSDIPLPTVTETPTIVSPTNTASPTDLPTVAPTETPAAVTPTISETATSTPIEMPTETPADMTPTAVQVDGVTVTAVQDTTCRRYPMRNSNPLGNLAVGSSVVVEGKDSSGEWFFIINPTNPVERMCWVWSGTLTVVGDVLSLENIPDSIND